MLRIDDTGINKNYGFKKDNPEKQNFTKLPLKNKGTSKLSDSGLLDHHSVIGQNTKKIISELYPEYDITRVIKPMDLNHERDKKTIQDLLKKATNDKNKIEFYDSELNLIEDKFLTYMQNISKSKFLLIGNFDNSDKPVIWEGLNRFQSNRNIDKYSKELEILENADIPAVMVTLTYDHKKRTLIEAWKNIAKDLHAFRKKLFYEIGKVPYMWVIEAQKSGYPHIHMLFFGKEYIFDNGTWEDYRNREAGITTDKSIQSMWTYGFTSVNRTEEGKEVKNPIHYVMKYVRKTWNDWNEETVLTKSMLWAFNKRSFNVSRDFRTYCDTLKPKETFNVEVVNNPEILELSTTAIITKKKFIPDEGPEEAPDMPLTFYVDNPNKDKTDYGVTYQCGICEAYLSIKEIMPHWKTHKMKPDKSLMRRIKI